MDSEERKRQFVNLLEDLLNKSCNGIQARLAEKLKIRTSRISRWLAGQVDPVNLETAVFHRIASSKSCSNEELAKSLGFSFVSKNAPNKFKTMLQEMLSNKTQEQLGDLIGVSQISISNWLNPQKNIDPGKIPAGTMFALAHEKGWKFDDLLIYLELIDDSKEKHLLIKYQSELPNLSLEDRLKLLVALTNSIGITLITSKNKQEFKISTDDRTLLIILEEENNEIASNYFSNLVEYLNFQAKNIKIATIPKLPQSLADIDILIFDINTTDSPSIQLIEDLTFNGDIIIFADAIALPLIRDRINSAVSEIFVKPVDWSAKQIFSLFSK